MLIAIGSLIVGFLMFGHLPDDATDIARWTIIGATFAVLIQGVFIAAIGQLLMLFMNVLEALMRIELNTRQRIAQE
jgi:predicted tellurium resistance membrane protein TerC